MSDLGSGIISISEEDGLIRVKSAMGVPRKAADEHFGRLLDVIKSTKARRERTLILIDMTEITNLNLASRRRILKFLRVKPDAVAYYGDIFKVELLLGYLSKLVNFIIFGFFKAETDAVAFLRKH
jgi:hypothetical protein